MIKHLDLCSGIGGFALAARNVGWQTIGFCDSDEWCRKILKKHWPNVPIYTDVKELPYDEIGPVDIITAGYPCQPFSVAGGRRGEEDDRHIWPYIAESVRRIEPLFCVFENVTGHISMGIDNVLSDMEGLGYTSEAFVIPACAVDAKHRRDRVWILAYVNSHSKSNGTFNEVSRSRKLVADTASQRQQRSRESINSIGSEEEGKGEAAGAFYGSQRCFWEPEPNVGRVANGVSRRMDRLRGLGNAIVPAVAEVIFEAINNEAL